MPLREAVSRTTFVDQQPVRIAFQAYSLSVLDGPEKKRSIARNERSLVLGSDPDSGLVLTDPGVSRRHARIEVDAFGYRIDDLGSKNGTFIEGRRVERGWLKSGDVLTLGKQRVRFEMASDEVEVRLSPHDHLGDLVGASTVMRELFAMVEQVAPSDATVLIEGETGTGKEGIAEALHSRSGRKGPLVVFDCSAVSPQLFESELFGHVKGAFTGADRERPGAMRAAQGGTLFLDEIGELPEALQPKLLRALEKREVRPVGADRAVPVEVRVVAATHRSLARDVEAGRFRRDLYFRLAVVELRLPPLRERLEDLPGLVRHFLKGHADRISFEAMQALRAHPWPGNVRELKNHLLKALAIGDADLSRSPPPSAGPRAPQLPATPTVGEVDVGRPFKEAKEALVIAFERRYWTELLAKTGDNLSEAARIAGVHRKSAEYVVQKLGIRGGGTP